MGNNLLENNPLWIVDVGASGGIDSRWMNFTKSPEQILLMNKISRKARLYMYITTAGILE